MNETASSSNVAGAVRYRVTGMDCTSCAAKIEKAARGVTGIQDVKVSTASQIMTLHVDEPGARLSELERAVTNLGYQLDRLDVPKAESGDDDDELPKDLSHITPAYKRALHTKCPEE
jgi:copper chaperone CopZ